MEITRTLEEQKRRMIQRAYEEHSEIRPCADKTDLWECFTSESERLLFWFNTNDDSTHLLTA